MAFAVSAWPYSPDPRSAHFAGHGWAFGAVPPWAWIVTTTNASGIWEPLNDGVIIKSSFDSLDLTLWASEDLEPDVSILLAKFGQVVPVGPSQSLVLTLQFHNGTPIELSEDHQLYSYPNGIRVFGGFDIVIVATGLPDPLIPDAVKITPAIWDIEP